MEYFQLAEDLNAMPLPVMACGVLCQARSDYANPAGGKLQEKYIGNFTDLIDFAISTAPILFIGARIIMIAVCILQQILI